MPKCRRSAHHTSRMQETNAHSCAAGETARRITSVPERIPPLRFVTQISRLRKQWGCARHRKNRTRISTHPYYTPKFTKIQAFLAKTAFFVDYDDIYVNIFMSTKLTEVTFFFIIFNFLTTSCVSFHVCALNIGIAIFLAILLC